MAAGGEPWRGPHWYTSPHNWAPEVAVSPRPVDLHDVTLRDGEECADLAWTVEDKVAIAEALAFAERRVAFGRPILEHPLMRRQFEERVRTLQAAFALAWTSVQMLDEVRMERPPYSPRYHLFRLLTHLAKYWTAEQAVQAAKWAMEVHGGMGVLGEYPVERWLREAMILPIWEGTPHRQILDGLEVMARKGAHRLLMEQLAPEADPRTLEEMMDRVEAHLRLPPDAQEAQAEPLFRDLARFTADTLLRRFRV